ncbi:DUF3848 domain-containing protein, partial [Dysosmobacter welbionis]
GGHGRTDQRQEVLDLVALLEVGDEAAVAGHALGGIAALPQQHLQLPAHLQVGGRQLQVVPLGRVRDAAPGEEHPPQEGRPAALLLQQSEVDVQGQVLLRAEAQQVHDPAELAAVCDLE